MKEQIDKAAASVGQMLDEWLCLSLSPARHATLVQLIAMRLERFWPEHIENSCGCIFCDIDLEPFVAEGFKWHKTNGREPVRCTKQS